MISTSAELKKLARQALAQMSGTAKCLTLYAAQHPRSEEAVEQLWRTIFAYLRQSDALVFDIEDGDIFHDRDLLVDESMNCRELIDAVESRGGNRLIFRLELTREELTEFLLLLNDDEDDTAEPAELGEHLVSAGIEHVEVKRMAHRIMKKRAPIRSEGSRADYYQKYERAIDGLSRVFETSRQNGSVEPAKIRAAAKWLSEAVAIDHEALVALTAIKNPGEYLCHHSVNVAVLTTVLGHAAGLDRERLEWLAEAGLLHDIGKTLIPSEILNKPGNLTTEEWALVTDHPIEGAEMLSSQNDIHNSSVVVAFEHHLGYDLSGYPTQTEKHRPHLFSRIVQVADVYDGLTADRAYHKAKLPTEAVSLLFGPMDHLFDPTLLKLFFRVIGVYPIGSLLQLSTDNIGLVRGVDPENLLRPIIKLLDLPEPKVVRLSDYPNIEIVAFTDPATAGVDLPCELSLD